jgi:hypothetical protein
MVEDIDITRGEFCRPVQMPGRLAEIAPGKLGYPHPHQGLGIA